jgi:UDP-glucose 4-epimerase
LVANPSLANSELGWQAQHTNIEEVIASAIKWQRDFPQGYSS